MKESINEIAFRMGLRKINEGGINRIMKHGENGFIIISANRSEIFSDNPKCDLSNEFIKFCKENNQDFEDSRVQTTWLQQRNNRCEAELKKILKQSKYAYTPVYGGYHGGDDVADSYEPSYIVYNHVKGGGAGDHLNFDELRDFAIELAKEFKQESVYVRGPGEAPNYIGQDGEIANSSSSKNDKINRGDEEFFTTAARDKKAKQRFTSDIQFESMYRKAGPSTYFERMKRRKLGEVFLDD